ncbi:hypothetical protein EVG20_g10515 [Dentipellis fragilis]|uniref:Uncharacterized protein n=1 Tax=Dentipellis fragilis TaxID=205917 RepID=A0A4Y9XR01_9AGAM|nr:hypothetical protein EVG20_g10515 [Dentipellis fragilis]
MAIYPSLTAPRNLGIGRARKGWRVVELGARVNRNTLKDPVEATLTGVPFSSTRRVHPVFQLIISHEHHTAAIPSSVASAGLLIASLQVAREAPAPSCPHRTASHSTKKFSGTQASGCAPRRRLRRPRTVSYRGADGGALPGRARGARKREGEDDELSEVCVADPAVRVRVAERADPAHRADGHGRCGAASEVMPARDQCAINRARSTKFVERKSSTRLSLLSARHYLTAGGHARGGSREHWESELTGRGGPSCRIAGSRKCARAAEEQARVNSVYEDLHLPQQ